MSIGKMLYIGNIHRQDAVLGSAWEGHAPPDDCPTTAMLLRNVELTITPAYDTNKSQP